MEEADIRPEDAEALDREVAAVRRQCVAAEDLRPVMEVAEVWDQALVRWVWLWEARRWEQVGDHLQGTTTVFTEAQHSKAVALHQALMMIQETTTDRTSQI